MLVGRSAHQVGEQQDYVGEAVLKIKKLDYTGFLPHIPSSIITHPAMKNNPPTGVIIPTPGEIALSADLSIVIR